MTHSFITECLVLKSVDYKEADRILTLFTKSNGKVSAIAKGVRKLTSRKSGSLDIFNHSKISLSEWKDFYIVTQAEVINSHGRLKKDLGSQSFLYLIGETLDKLLPYHEENLELFQKVVSKLNEMSKSQNARETMVDTLVIILSDLGYWSEKFPRDTDYIQRYIESLTDNELGSSKFMEKIERLRSDGCSSLW